MKRSFAILRAAMLSGVIWALSAQLSAQAQVTMQGPGDVVGTDTNAWSYLVLEGEDYDVKLNEAPDVGFVRVDNGAALTSFLGTPVLATTNTASGKAALFALGGSAHSDKVTYQVQFAKPGTYYLYMRFSMFESGSGEAHYLNEDSFFLPPGFDKDPQTDWPLTDPANGRNGGYTEGCCDGAGWLFIPSVGDPTRVSYTADTSFWEGGFHWNQLFASQFLDPLLSGEPGVAHKYEVAADQVGKPINFTLSYRENGVAVDLFLFSTHSNLLAEYSQADLDRLLIKGGVTVQDPGDVAGSGTNAWSYLVLEGEDYDIKLNEAPDVGFVRVDDSAALTSFLGTPVLATNNTASGKAALYALGGSAHSDKVTYQVQFAKSGIYYLYMRFSMFESGSGEAHYLNEDSFFLPPGFDKDPQTDWPLTDPANGRNGGYTEGCCDGAGWLFIPSVGDPTRVSYTADTSFWEGGFHWNQLFASQFLDPLLSGEPGVAHKYEVTESQVGKAMNFTLSYRENGVAVDLFLFSTHSNLLAQYSQAELDQILVTPAPGLAIGRTGSNVLLSWAASASGFALESADSLPSANWLAVTNPVVVLGDQNTVTADTLAATRYYRLKKP